jgi:excisionase family DNA binding protein
MFSSGDTLQRKIAMTHPQLAVDVSVLTVAEVAAYLKISPTTVWRHCSQGTLPAFRVGRQWRVERRDLDIWINRLKAEAGDQRGPKVG